MDDGDALNPSELEQALERWAQQKQHIGSRVRELREERHISQGKMAVMLGVGLSSLKNYEAGVRVLPLAVATRFCERFDVPIEYLTQDQ